MRTSPGCGCCGGDTPPCRSTLCVTLKNTCSGTVSGWDITLRDPAGNVVASCPSSWTCCVDIKAIGPGAYSATASKTIDLSRIGGPSSYTESIPLTIDVADECDAPNVVMDVRESWWAFALDCTCTGTGGCLVPTPVTFSCELGTWTGDASTTQRFVFTGFDPFDPAFDVIHWTASVSAASVEGTCSGTMPRCGPGGSETGNGGPFGGGIFHLLGDPSGCIHPVAGYFCSCCSAPVPITLHYSDGAGLACDVTYQGDPSQPLFGLWVGYGTQPSDVAFRQDAYGSCRPTDTAAADIWVWCECSDAGLVFRCRKVMYQCLRPPPQDAPPCTTGIDSPGGPGGSGVTDPVACDPTGLVASGVLTPDSCGLADTSGTFLITA